jgi:chaperone modulatory protein CbpM
MITIEVLITEVSGLMRQNLDRWITYGWVRPDGAPGQYVFHEIDVARVRLIQELHVHLQVNEEALPAVLSLLDQVYDLRRRMREIGDAVGRCPPELRDHFMQHLTQHLP